MSKIYKTALGKTFDMAAFAAKNEKVRAVGNMSVNAKGDIIDSNNKVISDANKRVSTMYKNTTKNLQKAAAKSVNLAETTKKELDDIDDDIPNPKK